MSTTGCTQEVLPFQGHFGRRVEADFEGGSITSDGGALLLREVALKTELFKKFAECFSDHRNPLLIEHTLEELISQRVYGLCLGYEDLNDHDELRHDPLFSLLAGKRNGESLIAGKSTLCRMERTKATPDARYHKIVCHTGKAERFFVDTYLQLEKHPPRRIILDLDATDQPLYGEQEGRFFHGYYGHYCYLPLYIFAGDHLLVAKERRSNCDAATGALEEVQRIVAQIRAKWPRVSIVLRGDSGFARDELMNWCEENGLHYLFGLARNNRLETLISSALEEAKANYEKIGEASRVFVELRYETLDSWTRKRRVIGKAEYLAKGANPRFIVTSLSRKCCRAMKLYEEYYCKRGDMENRIKEQLELFADRVSCHTMRGNQIRMWFSGLAYVLMAHLRRTALRATSFATAQMSTIRLKLFKIGAVITKSARRFYLRFASGYPYQNQFRQALKAIT